MPQAHEQGPCARAQQGRLEPDVAFDVRHRTEHAATRREAHEPRVEPPLRGDLIHGQQPVHARLPGEHGANSRRGGGKPRPSALAQHQRRAPRRALVNRRMRSEVNEIVVRERSTCGEFAQLRFRSVASQQRGGTRQQRSDRVDLWTRGSEGRPGCDRAGGTRNRAAVRGPTIAGLHGRTTRRKRRIPHQQRPPRARRLIAGATARTHRVQQRRGRVGDLEAVPQPAPRGVGQRLERDAAHDVG